MGYNFDRKHKIVVLGGGPGGYEAALAGAQLGAQVTLIERVGIGGSAVLTDVVPSKSLIATAEAVTQIEGSAELGVRFFVKNDSSSPLKPEVAVDLHAVNQRLMKLAEQQSKDVERSLIDAGVRIVSGYGRLTAENKVTVSTGRKGQGTVFEEIEADTIIVAVGARPRILDTAQPDGERILTWTELYDLDEVPEHLIVVGSGVTGAEFASAFVSLGSQVTLVSSRDQVLPGIDIDAAKVVEDVFRRSGMTVLSKSRAETVKRTENGVEVTLSDGQVISGSHCLMAVGSVPNTEDIGLEEAGVELTPSGHIRVNKVARTNIPSIYAAGDCSDFLPLASVAAMQGRTAVFHAMGDVVRPIDVRNVTSNIFTYPEIATIGWQQADIEAGTIRGVVGMVNLEHSNARAKMIGIHDGFVKIFSSTTSGTVIGAVIVSPRASELIFPLALAIEHRLTVDEVAGAFSVYPSLTEAISDAAMQLHIRPQGGLRP